MKPRIGIVTNFTGADESYSLVNVVRVQIEMLVNSGYNPVVFVAETFPAFEEGVWSGKQVEIRKVGLHQDSAEQIAEKYWLALQDIDVALCHDMVFLGNYKTWGDAVRVIAKELPLSWIHWQHSRGDGIVEPCDRSWYAYPNSGDLKHVARLNQTDVDRVRYIPHPLDFVYLDWPELAIKIAENTGHPWADVSIVYPSRLDRQKQLEKIVRIAGGIKKTGRTVSVIFADAMATGERFVQYKKEITQIAKEQDVETEVVFLGEMYEECKTGTPRKTVKALYEMSNLFIQPSTAETSSLVVMEAALAGNLLVLNADFEPILHLYNKALTLPFGSVTQAERGEKFTEYYRNVPTADGGAQKIIDPQQFWNDEAKNLIIPTLDSQLALSVKKQQLIERWPRHVFEEYLEPLIQEAYPKGSAVAEVLRGDPDVTAIITTLDNRPILEKQIDILLHEVGHIIIVNNGSKDDTKEWLESQEFPIEVVKYSECGSVSVRLPIEFINRENLGAGPGRNDGLDLWGYKTPYTLMVDGGILPPIGGVKQLKEYLERHPEAHVISPEVASCFTGDMSSATLIAPELPEDLQCFWQRCLSSTAYCLARASAWDVRFSEIGPYGKPGWGVDDNDMAYRWDDHDPPIVHHEFTHGKTGWLLYRRGSGSFQRLFEETGVWANQYGSVYEQRNVLCMQEWRKFHGPLYGVTQIPKVSYKIENIPMPLFAKLVKALHLKHRENMDVEIIAHNRNGDPEVQWWLDTFALRQTWGDVTFDPEGTKLIRGKNYPEELWSGNVVTWRDLYELHDEVVVIDNSSVAELFVNALLEPVSA